MLNKKTWYIERLRKDEIHGHKIRRRVARLKTSFQLAEIIDTADYGRCLFLDGLVQSTEADEFIYHEALIHPAMMLHPNPETVFVGGGGEGAPLREILKHPTVQHVDMVEIDGQVVGLAEKHLPSWHRGAYASPKVVLHIDDARAFLQRTARSYDVMVLDLCDPGESGPARKLFTMEFYRLLRERLSRSGLVVVQGGSANINMLEGYARVYQSLKKNFRTVLPYQACVHAYVGQWGYFLAGDGRRAMAATAATLERRFRERRLAGKTKFYAPAVHAGLFAQPPYLGEFLRKGRAISDRRILAVPRQ
jgi:spermidine synthase